MRRRSGGSLLGEWVNNLFRIVSPHRLKNLRPLSSGQDGKAETYPERGSALIRRKRCTFLTTGSGRMLLDRLKGIDQWDAFTSTSPVTLRRGSHATLPVGMEVGSRTAKSYENCAEDSRKRFLRFPKFGIARSEPPKSKSHVR